MIHIKSSKVSGADFVLMPNFIFFATDVNAKVRQLYILLCFAAQNEIDLTIPLTKTFLGISSKTDLEPLLNDLANLKLIKYKRESSKFEIELLDYRNSQLYFKTIFKRLKDIISDVPIDDTVHAVLSKSIDFSKLSADERRILYSKPLCLFKSFISIVGESFKEDAIFIQPTEPKIKMINKLLRLYIIEYKKRYGITPVGLVLRKFQNVCKSLFDLMGYTTLSQALIDYLASNDKFYLDTAHPPGLFPFFLQKWLVNKQRKERVPIEEISSEVLKEYLEYKAKTGITISEYEEECKKRGILEDKVQNGQS